jgi:flagellar hook protein FlgE
MNTGNTAGQMKGISIDQEGKIWGTYDNGMKKCLAQMAVATFANPSGLESIGSSLFQATLNSGDFDGVGEEISLSGSFTVGALEMSNVDLATEFTQMITTQRGFQANSRIITTSDSMLEELVNLKR